MKLIAALLILALVNTVAADSDSFKVKSPADEFSVIFERPSDREDFRLKVISSQEKILFRSDRIGLTIQEGSILWNSTSDRLAFSAGTHFLMETYVLSKAKHGFILSKLPGPQQGLDNFHQVPRRWTKDVLILSLDGPHAGKADNKTYKGQMKIKVSDTPSETTILSEKVDMVEQGS